METLLNSCLNKKVWIFIEQPTVRYNICGVLKYGRNPKRPYSIHVEQPDGTFDQPQAEISFTAADVKKHHCTHGIDCFGIV